MSKYARSIAIGVMAASTLAAPLCAADNTVKLVSTYGTSAATTAIGGIEGFGSGAYSVFENPAALRHSGGLQLSSYYMGLADGDSTYFNVALAYPLWGGTIAAGFAQLQSPNLNNTYETTYSEFEIIGNFSVSDTVLKAGYSMPIFDQWTAGIGGTYMVQDLFLTKGTGWNLDAGLSGTYGQAAVSLTAKNFLSGSDVAYTNGYARLAFQNELVLGVRYNIWDNLAVYGQLSGEGAVESGAKLKSVGVKYSPIPMITLMAGSQASYAAGKHRATVAGVSLSLAMMDLNFSYQNSQLAGFESLYGLSVDVKL